MHKCINIHFVLWYNENMEEVSLRQVLDARERRAAKQRELLGSFGAPLVVLTVNTPGPVKRFAAADRVFCAGCCEVRRVLGAHAHELLMDLPTGMEGYWSPAISAEAAKRLCCRLEETLPYGRLLDLDVLDESGAPMSRTALGFAPRGCMVCGRPGAYCASRRIHPLPEIVAAFERMAAAIGEEKA